MTPDGEIRPFRIEIPQADVDDLHERLRRTRFPGQLPGTGWERGVPADYLEALAETWANDYDWRAEEAKLNAIPQFTTRIDGQTIHFLHVRSTEPDALPLLLCHGYPGSFVDYVGLIERLTDPRADGGEAVDAFDVVIPSVPGFGFSTPVTETGWEATRSAKAVAELMVRLGYERYGTHGYDVGAGVCVQLGTLVPDAVVGMHYATDPASLAYLGMLPEPGDDASDAEQATVERLRGAAEDGTGYLRLQSTRPQTIGVGLTDSPTLQLAWIVEKFKEWTDPTRELPEEAVDRDALLTNVSVYWFTKSGASAAQFIYEAAHAMRDWSRGPEIPTGVSVFDSDPIVRKTLDPEAQNPHWFEHERGGHFPSLEVPDLLVDDLRTFFRRVRAE